MSRHDDDSIDLKALLESLLRRSKRIVRGKPIIKPMIGKHSDQRELALRLLRIQERVISAPVSNQHMNDMQSLLDQITTLLER